MNEQNLILNSERTPTELQEIAKRGGVASGIARRKKRTLKEIAILIGEQPFKHPEQIEALQQFADIPEEITHDIAYIARHYLEAERGNVGSARFIAQIRGELADKKQIEGLIMPNFDILRR